MYAILLLIVLNPRERVTVDVVDRIELSHVFNSEGVLCLDQIIAWDWDWKEDRYQVVAWRLLKGVRCDDEKARKAWNPADHGGWPFVPEWIGGHATPRKIGDVWVCEWYDEQTRKHRRVVANCCIETACTFDRELNERQILPENKRRQLK